jgi:hypothetical protein
MPAITSIKDRTMEGRKVNILDLVFSIIAPTPEKSVYRLLAY